MSRPDNYAIQATQAKKLFLTYDQNELIQRCHLHFDEAYFYISFLSEPYRICRQTGNMERLQGNQWIDGNSFGEVMTILDWLCDSRADRYITGRWVNLITQGYSFHTKLQEDPKDLDAEYFDQHPEAFSKVCMALGGEKVNGADISYVIELIDGLKILVQLWHGDDEFAPRLCFLWEENTLQYIRYETTWFAKGLILSRMREHV